METTSTKNNVWILTEERPKIEIVMQIIKIYDCLAVVDRMKILPVIKDYKFHFMFEIQDVQSKKINKIFLKIVSGYSSFVDYLFFATQDEPNEDDQFNGLLYAIEETKTDSNESRNTSAGQRATKFAFLNYLKQFNKVNFDIIMLYNKSEKQNKIDPPSVVFMKRCLKTVDVKFLGDNSDDLETFNSIDQVIEFKNSMRSPPGNNTPVRMYKGLDFISITGILSKPSDAGNISHDPNIGQIVGISNTLRKLGWNKKIIVKDHQVKQTKIDKMRGNKFLFASKMFEIDLEGIKKQNYDIPLNYWKYDNRTEKVATILLHMLIAGNEKFHLVYENHAGSERGYFYDEFNSIITIPKKYQNSNINLPDFVFADLETKSIFMCEGEMKGNEYKGLEQIENFHLFENLYLKKYYENFTTKKFLIISNGNTDEIMNETLFQVNSDGTLEYNELLPLDIAMQIKT